MSVAIPKDRAKNRPLLEAGNGLRFKTGRGRKGAPVIWEHQGWLRQKQRHGSIQSMADCLAAHADWAGPSKLVWTDEACWKITEVYLSHADFGDELLDDESSQENNLLMSELIEETFKRKPKDKAAGWEPPSTSELAGWLEATGHTATVDEDENLRLTLKSRGCDGQVRVTSESGRLRLAMRLGSWSKLDPAAEEAILHLSNEANARGRMFRIAWLAEKEQRKCEAQVDLTGLPTAGHVERLWPDVIRTSVASLELALRWLGRELEVLADGKNLELARELLQTADGRPRQPR